MAYLGNNLQVAYPSYRTIDDISSQFNGVLKTFALQIGGVAAVPFPINPQQCLISVNGVIQKPDSTGTTGFTLTGTNIVFASAPSAGWAFFGTVLAGADYVNVGANFPSGTAAVPSVTFDQSTSTGLYLVSSNVLGIATSGVQQLTVDSSGNVGITGSVSSAAGTAAAPAYRFTGDTNTGIYSPAADTLAFVEGGVEAMRIDSSGRLGIGTSAPGAKLTIQQAANTITEGLLLVASSGSVNGGWYHNGSALVGREGGFDTINLAAGKVGIGTTSPSQLLTLQQTSAGAAVDCLFLNNSSVNANTSVGIAFGPNTTNAIGRSAIIRGINESGGSGNATGLQFLTNPNGGDPTEKARIDSSGRLLVGTTSGSGKLTVSGNAIGTTVALTDAATVATDLSLANYYTLTLGGNRTLGAPTNQTAGQSGVIVITQDGTGSRTLAYNSVWKFPNGTVPTLTTTASAVDVLAYYVESGTRITARLLSDVK
jgi:hypothetical protein